MPDNEPLILTKEKRGQRYLPIRIGPVEATAIAFYQQRMMFARPQTHDLMRDILRAINVRLVSATLVVRTGAQLLVTTGILDEAGVPAGPSP
jgi:uncharacterized protein